MNYFSFACIFFFKKHKQIEKVKKKGYNELTVTLIGKYKNTVFKQQLYNPFFFSIFSCFILELYKWH